MKLSKANLIVAILFFLLTTAFFVVAVILAEQLYGGDANVWWFWLMLSFFICSVPLLTVGIWANVSYTCKKCGKTIKPSYWKWLIAYHCGFSRRVYCPKCNKKVWGKATI